MTDDTNKKPSFFDKVSGAVNQGINKTKQMIDDKKKEMEDKKAAEAARILSIKEGNFDPIDVEFTLEDGEEAYLKIPAERFAKVETVVQQTFENTKRKGTLGRAVVGGVLLGPLGAVAGAATAKKQTTGHTSEEVISSIKSQGAGTLLFTNKRFLFVASNILSIPYTDVVSVEFKLNRAYIHYNGMMDSEYFQLKCSFLPDLPYYYEGIKAKRQK